MNWPDSIVLFALQIGQEKKGRRIMTLKKITAALALTLLLHSSLMAGVIPGRWEKMGLESAGAAILVTLYSGEKVEGTYKSLTQEALVLLAADGNERQFRKLDIARIVSADARPDSKWNGALIGALVGGVPIFIAIASDKSNEMGIGLAALGGLVTGGIGALIGYGIDAAVKGPVLLYEGANSSESALLNKRK
jgi:hypothetical protein